MSGPDGQYLYWIHFLPARTFGIKQRPAGTTNSLTCNLRREIWLHLTPLAVSRTSSDRSLQAWIKKLTVFYSGRLIWKVDFKHSVFQEFTVNAAAPAQLPECIQIMHLLCLCNSFLATLHVCGYKEPFEYILTGALCTQDFCAASECRKYLLRIYIFGRSTYKEENNCLCLQTYTKLLSVLVYNRF